MFNCIRFIYSLPLPALSAEPLCTAPFIHTLIYSLFLAGGVLNGVLTLSSLGVSTQNIIVGDGAVAVCAAAANGQNTIAFGALTLLPPPLQVL